MKKSYLLIVLAIIGMCYSCGTKKDANPFFSEYQTKFGVPPFDKIKLADYEPAVVKGIAQQNELIAKIVANKAKPTFENTILAFEKSSPIIDRMSEVFFNMIDADSNDSLQALAMKLQPMLTAQSDNIYLNQALFARIKQVHDNVVSQNLTKEQRLAAEGDSDVLYTETLTKEQQRLVEKRYRDFVRSGANLSESDKARLRDINTELSKLTLTFSNNILGENNAFQLFIDKESDLAGLPQWFRQSAAEEAKAAGKSGQWLVKLTSDSRIPFLQYSSVRPLREKVYKAYINRGNNNDKYDNKQIITKILSLRLEKAKLMGFDCYSNYSLEPTMAKNSENVMKLLLNIWKYSLDKAKTEASELQQMMDKEGKGEKLEAWDWPYYTEKVREAKYNLNEEDVKPYFKLENVLNGAMECAHRLYGISFSPLSGMPVYEPDVKVYEVKDADGSHLGVLYFDYFPRAGKKGGAWMSNYREEEKGIRPVICNVASFTKPVGDMPSLLTIDEVETLFHEFGHAMHGMLSQCNYKGVSGTNVSRDFVEFFSQFNEHWATAPEALKMYAHHYKTGEVIPDSLINKILKQKTFNQGFITTELLAASLLDMELHNLKSMSGYDVLGFEKKAMEQLGLISAIDPRYRTTYFNHIVGGYDAGYYSYIWSNVLDCDAFEVFKEKGIFDKTTANRFRHCLLERGDSDDPMTLYKEFRGSEPQLDPLLEDRGMK
jgi:peptidyl-dipeptidase Dcp